MFKPAFLYLLLVLFGPLNIDALTPSPTSPYDVAAPDTLPTPPPDISSLAEGDYPRPGCPVYSCLACGGDFYVTLAATGSTDCHFCACAPRTVPVMPDNCSVSYCYNCGWPRSSVVFTTPSAQTCPACGCAAIPGQTPTSTGVATMWGQCGGLGWTGPTICQCTWGATAVECSTLNSLYAQCLPAHTPTPVPIP